MTDRVRALLLTGPVVAVASAAMLRDAWTGPDGAFAFSVLLIVFFAVFAPVLPFPVRSRESHSIRKRARRWTRFLLAVSLLLCIAMRNHSWPAVLLLMPAAARSGRRPRTRRSRLTLRDACAAALLHMALTGTTASLLAAAGAMLLAARALPAVLGPRPVAPPRGSGRMVVAVGLLALALALVFPSGRSPSRGEPRQTAHASPGGFPVPKGQPSGVAIPGREITLGDVGRLQLDPRAMLELTFSRSSETDNLADIGPLLRGASLDRFDGTRWSSDERPARTLRDEQDGNRDGWIALPPLPAREPPRSEWLAVSIRYLSGGSDSLFLPGLPARLGGDAVSDGALQSFDGELRGATDIAENAILLARCRVVPGDMPPLRQETLHRDRRAELLRIPVDHAPLVALAERALGESAKDRRLLRSLERLLHERCDYSLEIADPGDLPPLVAFMEKSRRGHCELFASAAVVMLRSLGVPARIAIGFRGGERNPVTGTYRFRGTDAHAWVEAHLEGEGWVTFDPTPDGDEAATTDDAAAEEDDTVAVADSSWLDGLFREDGLRGLLQSAWRSATRWSPPALPSLPWLLAGLTLLLVALRLRHRRATAIALPLPAPPLSPMPTYFERLHEVLRSAGLPRRAAETPREWTLRAAAAGASPVDALATLVHAYERQRWAGESPGPDQCRYLENLAASVAVHEPGASQRESNSLN